MDNYTNFITVNAEQGFVFKSFINCKNFQKWEQPTHKAEGAVFPLDNIGRHKAWINHYFTKSWEEWKIKILERGDTCPGNRKIDDFFLHNPDMLPLKEQLMSEVTERYKGEKK